LGSRPQGNHTWRIQKEESRKLCLLGFLLSGILSLDPPWMGLHGLHFPADGTQEPAGKEGPGDPSWASSYWEARTSSGREMRSLPEEAHTIGSGSPRKCNVTPNQSSGRHILFPRGLPFQLYLFLYGLGYVSHRLVQGRDHRCRHEPDHEEQILGPLGGPLFNIEELNRPTQGPREGRG